ncbi:MAG: phenylalanine--tRNA ligase subunit alpha, partial [Candidatus Poribacteria bacterium]
MNEQIEALRADAVAAIGEAASLHDLEETRVRFLGRRSELTGLRKGIGQLSGEQRPIVGKLLTELQGEITATLEAR